MTLSAQMDQQMAALNNALAGAYANVGSSWFDFAGTTAAAQSALSTATKTINFLGDDGYHQVLGGRMTFAAWAEQAAGAWELIRSADATVGNWTFTRTIASTAIAAVKNVTNGTAAVLEGAQNTTMLVAGALALLAVAYLLTITRRA